MERLPALLRHRAWHLFLISFLALFFELALIRWIPTRLRVLAYFSNFILIAALLGLGLGMLIAGRWRRTLNRFPLMLAVLVLLVVLIERSGLVLPLANESNFIWNGLSRQSTPGPLPYVLLVGFFTVTAIMFVPLGQEVGLQLERFRPIAGYSINIFGSLLGIVAFAAISYFSWPPVAWFALGGALFVAFLLTSSLVTWRGVATAAVVLGAGAALVGVAHRVAPGRYLWSPYYEIRVEELRLPSGEDVGFQVVVNLDSHQQALDLSDGGPDGDFVTSRRNLYDLPYTVSSPRDVLVLGAGTGNDVAAALRNGVQRVDAVEIDPVILDLGELHHERPYADPRVHGHVDDARSFLEKNDRRYDLIVFGFLDSHRLFSSMSSVRLDNYIYTVENIENVRRHLRDDGTLSLTFTVHEQWIADRLFALLSGVFGHEPTVYQGNQWAWGTTFLVRRDGPMTPAGPLITPDRFADEVLSAVEGNTWAYSATAGFLDNSIFNAGVEAPTDDWPYLYMRSRQLPGNYGAVLLLTFVVAALLIRWGARPTGLGYEARLLLAGLQVSLPLFFAGVIFATHFRRVSAPSAALGANLIGAVAGGLLEYGSLLVGQQALFLGALAFYLLSVAIVAATGRTRSSLIGSASRAA